MSKSKRYIFMLLLAAILMVLSLLLYLNWVRQETTPSGGTKFVEAGELSRV